MKNKIILTITLSVLDFIAHKILIWASGQWTEINPTQMTIEIILASIIILIVLWCYWDMRERIKIIDSETEDMIDMLITAMVRRTRHIYNQLWTKPSNQIREPERYLTDEEIKWFKKANERLKNKINKINSSDDQTK